MKPGLVAHLVCPIDGTPLSLEVVESEGDEIKTGHLRGAGGREYPIRDFIPRFVDTDSYVASFSRQREHVRRHLDSYLRNFNLRAEGDAFVQSTGFGLSQLDGLTLDAGCGIGRFLRVVDAAGGEVIGVDLSSQTVELAFDFTRHCKRVHIVQADLTRLPFAAGHFRRVFSIGVLDHTPNTRAAFEQLTSHIAAGGEIAIWVYAPDKRIASNRWRRLTTKLPLGVVYAWCVVNEALFAWARTLPRGGGRVAAIIPGGTLDTSYWSRVMGNFDNLTPRFAHAHTGNEVREWFVTAGLTDVAILARPTAVRGRKPALTSLPGPAGSATHDNRAPALIGSKTSRARRV